MNINTLIDALEYYVMTADVCDMAKEDALIALKSCVATKERCSDLCHERKNEVTLLTENALDNILNMDTYDILGKRLRIHGPNMPFEYYENDCRKDWRFEDFTKEQLEVGFEICKNLWQDNEKEGDNAPDGTFSTASKRILHEAKEYCETIKATADDEDAIDAHVEAQYNLQDLMTENIDYLLENA